MKKLTINVNGSEKTLLDYKKKFITYEQVVRLTGRNPETTLYTVTFYKGYAPKSEGILTPGQKVRIKKGMVFNAYYTGNA
jgi:hypothetical protein